MLILGIVSTVESGQYCEGPLSLQEVGGVSMMGELEEC